MPDLKPCPFCGSTDIRYSLKITGRYDIRYHASMYCNKCHCYGARTLTKSLKHDDYKGRSQIEADENIKLQAAEAWNARTKEPGNTTECDDKAITCFGTSDNVEQLKEILQRTQSVTIDSTRYGKWIKQGMITRCSQCGNRALHNNHQDLILSNYCPHCGVKIK